jgi:hypothetical protein
MTKAVKTLSTRSRSQNLRADSHSGDCPCSRLWIHWRTGDSGHGIYLTDRLSFSSAWPHWLVNSLPSSAFVDLPSFAT